MHNIDREWKSLFLICENIKTTLKTNPQTQSSISIETIMQLVSDLNKVYHQFDYTQKWKALPEDWKHKIHQLVLECNRLVQLHMKLITHEIHRIQSIWQQLKGEQTPERVLTYEKPRMQNR